MLFRIVFTIWRFWILIFLTKVLISATLGQRVCGAPWGNHWTSARFGFNLKLKIFSSKSFLYHRAEHFNILECKPFKRMADFLVRTTENLVLEELVRIFRMTLVPEDQSWCHSKAAGEKNHIHWFVWLVMPIFRARRCSTRFEQQTGLSSSICVCVPHCKM